ncbi:hypothetical protein SISSUDRAFT_1061709 [Sistotremastrum suecicum HHB10207 ss-3]|uniref:G-protein coupled receptors family 1 profile domain-containing protein n=1 Tax=Sistotremastrum suecicum HHB10207 ss-3 TaxID=1314776 RepID=A0A166DQ64_9AGAM|nr:hypothetical protein SISSUDRAFT_1061709 [Sistotremastrum suecicum HHB10207 ss-3]
MIINPDAPIFSSTAAVCTKELEFRVGVGCSLYSILFILFTVTLHVFIVQYRFRSSFPLILVTLVITLSIATVTFTLTMINISAELQPIDITPAGSFVGCQLNPSPAYLGVLFTLQLMVVDTFTIYRTWLLYGRRFSVVVFPILCDLGVFALLLYNAIDSSGTYAQALPYILGIPLSFVLNITCTALIAVHLTRTHFQGMQLYSRMVVPFIVITGTIHNVVLVVMFVSIFTGLVRVVDAVGPVTITATAAITFDLLVLHIALTKAFCVAGCSKDSALTSRLKDKVRIMSYYDSIEDVEELS